MRAIPLRALAAVAASTGMTMRQWDFVAAYLQGWLDPARWFTAVLHLITHHAKTTEYRKSAGSTSQSTA
eukprot:4875083-Pleurochrysis_carterae.AAC.4